MPRVSGRNVGGSLAFNGSTSLVTIPTSASINTITTSATVSMYVYRNSDQVAANEYLMISGGSKWFYRIDSLTGGLLRFYYDGSNSILNGPKLKKGVWQHVVTTLAYNGTNITGVMYINGVQVYTNTGTGTTVSINGLSLTIGNNGNSLNGKVSDFCVHNRALTATEVSQMYFNNIVPTSGLVTRQPLQEMTGSTALDTSGNSNNGTIVSGTWSTDRPFANRKPVVDLKSSLSSTGNNGYVTIGTGLNTAINTAQAYTIACSVKRSSLGTLQSFFGEANNDKWWFNFLTDNSIRVYHSDLTPATINNTIKIVNNFSWIRLVATYNGSRIRIYADNQLINETAVTGTLNLNQTMVLLAFAGGNNFLGNAQNYKLWSRELTLSEVGVDYIGGEPSGILEAWAMTEGAGSIVYSRSGNNNGTITSATWSSDTPSKTRKQVGGNMIPNGDMSKIPVVNVPTTVSQTWVDGTASGSTNIETGKIFSYPITTTNNGFSALFDTTNLSPIGSPSFKISTTAINSYIESHSSRSDTNASRVASAQAGIMIPILPNTSYTGTFYAKTQVNSGDSNNGASFSFVTVTGDGATIAGYQSSAFSAVAKVTSTWTKYTVTFTTEATARYLAVYKLIYGHTGAGTLIMDAWFANISLVPTSQLTASATSRLPSSRLVVGGNLIANGDMSYIPSSNVALTTTKKWLDGTAGGSSTFDGFRWGATIIGTSSTLFDTTNKYNNNSSIKGSLVGVNSYIEISITPDNSISTNIKKYAIPVLPNTSYTTIYAMKTNYISGDSNNGAVVYNTCWDGTGAFTSNRNTPTAIKTTTGWTIYTNQFTTGANDRFVTITPSLEGRTGTATLIMDAWFANITLTPTVNTVRTQVS